MQHINYYNDVIRVTVTVYPLSGLGGITGRMTSLSTYTKTRNTNYTYIHGYAYTHRYTQGIHLFI